MSADGLDAGAAAPAEPPPPDLVGETAIETAVGELRMLDIAAQAAFAAGERLSLAADSIDGLSQDLAALVTRIGAEIAQAGDEVTASLDSMRAATAEAVRAAEDHLIKVIHRANFVVQQAQVRVNELGTTAGVAESKLQEHRDAIDAAFTATDSTIASARADAVAALEEAGGAVLEHFSSVTEALEAIREAIDEKIEAATAEVAEEMREPIEASVDKVGELIERIKNTLEQDVTSKVKAFVAESLTDALNDDLKALTAALRDEVVGLIRSIEDDTDKASVASAALEECADMLKSAVDPALGALDRFRGLASSVGVSI